MALISIVLPTYNRAEYLHESIGSILFQSFEDWELIVVDDCSSDNTIDVLDEYVKKDRRIKYIRHSENKKLPAALNTGFSLASGEFLTWTSDDNLYYPNALQIMKTVMDENPNIDMVFARMNYIDSSGKVLDIKNSEPIENIFLYNIIGACFLYRKYVAKAVGEYDTNLFCAEDYDYWLRISSRFKLMSINQVLYSCRLHPGRLTETKKELIGRQVTKAWNKNLDDIVYRLRNNPALLFKLYIAWIKRNKNNVNDGKKILLACPSLRNIARHLKMDLDEKPIIIFGAGMVGEKLFKILKSNKIIAFADNDFNKVGALKNGIPIISFEEMVMQSNDVNIVLGVTDAFKYTLACQLEAHGVRRYSIVAGI